MAGPSTSYNLTSEQIVEYLDEPGDSDNIVFDSGSEIDSDESDEDIVPERK